MLRVSPLGLPPHVRHHVTPEGHRRDVLYDSRMAERPSRGAHVLLGPIERYVFGETQLSLNLALHVYRELERGGGKKEGRESGSRPLVCCVVRASLCRGLRAGDALHEANSRMRLRNRLARIARAPRCR